MKTAQARIAIIFSSFLLALCFSKLLLCAIRCEPIINAFVYPRIVYWIMLPLFIITFIKNNTASKVLQVGLLLFGSLWNFSNSGSNDFFGIAGLSVSFFLAFHYGFFNKQKHVKIVILNVILFICFSTFASFNSENKIIHATEVLGFFDVFIFIIWAIFKDSIDKIKEIEDYQRKRCIKIMDEATSVARDAIALCEEENNKLNR